MLLVGPDDMMNFKKIFKTLGKDEELPMFPIETKCMEAIKVSSSASGSVHAATFLDEQKNNRSSKRVNLHRPLV